MMNSTVLPDLNPWPQPAHDAAAELASLSKTLHDTVNIAAGLAARMALEWAGGRIDALGAALRAADP